MSKNEIQRRLVRNEKARRRRALEYVCRHLPTEVEKEIFSYMRLRRFEYMHAPVDVAMKWQKHPTSLIIKNFALRMKTYAVLGQTECHCGNSWKVLTNVILPYLVPIVPDNEVVDSETFVDDNKLGTISFIHPDNSLCNVLQSMRNCFSRTMQKKVASLVIAEIHTIPWIPLIFDIDPWQERYQQVMKMKWDKHPTAVAINEASEFDLYGYRRAINEASVTPSVT